LIRGVERKIGMTEKTVTVRLLRAVDTVYGTFQAGSCLEVLAADAQAMVVTVTRERFKDTASMQPLAFEAVEVDLGRVDKYGEAVKSLVMRETNAPTKAAAVHSPQGKAQRTILFALRERQKKSETPLVWTVEEIRQIGRECGVPRQSVHDAVEKLMLSPFLRATVGGSMLGEP
jgi:hypothetical protein